MSNHVISSSMEHLLQLINLSNSFWVVFFVSQVFQAKECGSPGRTKRSTDDFFLEGNSRQRREDDALARTSSQVNLDR